jgi:S1-C subfamily serine protease
MKKFLVILMSSLVLSMALPAIAHADWVEYKTGALDNDPVNKNPPRYDIYRLDYAVSQTDPDEFWFYLHFISPITANMFNDGTGAYADLTIDTNSDVMADYRIETPRRNFESNFSSPANLYNREGKQIPCDSQVWTNLDKGVSWIAFSIKKNCINFNKSFRILAKAFAGKGKGVDNIVDFTPDGYWTITPGSEPARPPSSVADSSAVLTQDLPNSSEIRANDISSPSLPPTNLVTLIQGIAPSVATILCGKNSGTGWSINAKLSNSLISRGNKSYFITNHHVVEDCLLSGDVTLVLDDKRRIPGKIWSWNKDDDTAGIVTTVQVPGLTWSGVTPQQGWWLGVYGSPLGYPGVLTTGIVSSLNSQNFILTTTAPLNPGNSGGPVFDRQGRVVGLATAKFVDSEGFGIVHGTPLLCNKVINCLDKSQIWITDPSLIKSEISQDAKAKAQAELETKQLNDSINKCIKFNGELDLAIFNAKTAVVRFPSSKSAFESIISISPVPLDCNKVNVVTIDAELQGKQRLLTTFNDAITREVASAQIKATGARQTITCIKGKQTKKITAVNPKCPSGFKKR